MYALYATRPLKSSQQSSTLQQVRPQGILGWENRPRWRTQLGVPPQRLHYPEATAGNHPRITRHICSVVNHCPSNQRLARRSAHMWTSEREGRIWAGGFCVNITQQLRLETHRRMFIPTCIHSVRAPLCLTNENKKCLSSLADSTADFQEIPQASAFWN